MSQPEYFDFDFYDDIYDDFEYEFELEIEEEVEEPEEEVVNNRIPMKNHMNKTISNETILEPAVV